VKTFEEAAEGFVGWSWAGGFAEVVFRLRKYKAASRSTIPAAKRH